MQFNDTMTPRATLAYMIHAYHPNFAGPDPRLMAALAALPGRTRRGLGKLGQLRQQRGALGCWIRDAIAAVNAVNDAGELSRQERAKWTAKLHRAHGRLGKLDGQVVQLEGALLESV